MNIALVHDWLVTYAGAERVVEQMLALYPDADLYSLFDFLDESERHGIKRTAGTSFIQGLPCSRTRYRTYLPLMPFAIRQFDLSRYDLILSSSHAVAKGVLRTAGQLHICYCHTPMRYAWDLRDQYLKEAGLNAGLKGFLAKLILDRLQVWDAATAEGVDHFIANSRYIADRISRAYGRESTVIYPPVDVESFALSMQKEDYYLAASRFVPYKKMDLIVEAFRSLPDRKLVVIGNGPDFDKVRAKAGRNIVLLGHQSEDALVGALQRARAFVFAAEEDFGILPVEAQACGTPVIAYGKGGAIETVVPLPGMTEGARSANEKPTGVFFAEQTTESLCAAVRKFEDNREAFDPAAIRRNAERFGRERFLNEFRSFIEMKVRAHRGSSP